MDDDQTRITSISHQHIAQHVLNEDQYNFAGLAQRNAFDSIHLLSMQRLAKPLA